MTVALDLRDIKSKALVVDAIREWAHHTPGLQFRIISGKTGDIRISDDEGLKGNWSYMGTDAKKRPKHLPTLHLDRDDNSKEFRQTALHEFGHALGLGHEHQHPEHDINWDKNAVYNGYVSPDFSRERVHSNFFKLPTGSELLVTGYDPKSVMHYRIHPGTTKDARSSSQNYSLSKGDKEIIRRLYTPGRFQGTDYTSA